MAFKKCFRNEFLKVVSKFHFRNAFLKQVERAKRADPLPLRCRKPSCDEHGGSTFWAAPFHSATNLQKLNPTFSQLTTNLQKLNPPFNLLPTNLQKSGPTFNQLLSQIAKIGPVRKWTSQPTYKYWLKVGCHTNIPVPCHPHHTSQSAMFIHVRVFEWGWRCG